MSEFIQVENLEEFADRLRELGAGVTREVDRQLRKSAMKVVSEAQQNIRKAPNANNTGAMSNSGKVRGKTGGLEYEAGFASQYAYYVEHGRKAGRMPPVKLLAEWAKKKLRVDDKRKMSVGYLVARKIARKGTRPNPFLKPAFDKVTKALGEDVARAVKKWTLSKFGV